MGQASGILDHGATFLGSYPVRTVAPISARTLSVDTLVALADAMRRGRGPEVTYSSMVNCSEERAGFALCLWAMMVFAGLSGCLPSRDWVSGLCCRADCLHAARALIAGCSTCRPRFANTQHAGLHLRSSVPMKSREFHRTSAAAAFFSEVSDGKDRKAC